MNEIAMELVPAQDQIDQVTRVLRDLPPAHYIFKINNFSFLLSNPDFDKYQSTDFDVAGYKWKLCVGLTGDNNRFISLYLVFSESNSIASERGEVNVYFKLFVYNKILDKYLTVQDSNGSVRRFHQIKKEWGFDQLIPLNVFNDASNGYLVDDCCIFGAELFVLENPSIRRGECASIKHLPNSDNTYDWYIRSFPSLQNESYRSNQFVIGGYKWTLLLYPNGDSSAANRQSLSLFLSLDDQETLQLCQRLCTRYILRVTDHDTYHSRHHERRDTGEHSASSRSCGFSDFMPIRILNNSSPPYLSYYDSLRVQVKFLSISIVEDFPIIL
ncbi:TRAF-like family protein [Euphorbia peplus]|nr:TRAF-like family protein [Euphorbia peplus]